MFRINTIIPVCFAAAVSLAATHAARATTLASSTFDSGSEGWMVGDIDNTSVTMEGPTYQSSAGNPGGYISTTDDYDIVGFFAPTAFIGNQTAALGGTFSFDLKDAYIDGVSYPALFLYGDGKVVSATANPPSTTSFTSYSFTLSASDFDIFTPSGGNESQSSTPVTDTEFATILSNLTDVAIEADWHSGADLTSLDNVAITSAPTTPPDTSVPEPMSIALLGSGLIGIASIRARRKA